MKKQLLLSSLILLFVASFTACKKDSFEEKPLTAKILGKWRVDKVEYSYVSVENPTTFTASDYIDFKDNTNNDFELGLGVNRQVGTFSGTIDNSFFLDFSSKDLECTATTLTENKFTFTGTIVGSNPKKTETYYLSR